jgi:hypothetical protein
MQAGSVKFKPMLKKLIEKFYEKNFASNESLGEEGEIPISFCFDLDSLIDEWLRQKGYDKWASVDDCERWLMSIYALRNEDVSFGFQGNVEKNIFSTPGFIVKDLLIYGLRLTNAGFKLWNEVYGRVDSDIAEDDGER